MKIVRFLFGSLLMIIGFVIIYLAFIKSDEKIEFELIGSSNIIHNLGEEYHDLGVIAKENDVDYSSEVKINNNVNINLEGKYTVTYEFRNKELTRYVNVSIKKEVTPTYLNPVCCYNSSNGQYKWESSGTCTISGYSVYDKITTESECKIEQETPTPVPFTPTLVPVTPTPTPSPIITPVPVTPSPTPTVEPVKEEPGKLEIHLFGAGGFYDDAILIRTKKATMFIDGGRGDSEVVKYLNSLKITKIDYVIGSHTEYDHMHAHGAVIDNFQVDNLMYANDIRSCGCRCESTDVRATLSALSKKNVPITIPQVPSTLTIGDMTLYILAPWQLGCNKNNNSLVFILKYGNNTFMFTGDSDSPFNDSNKLIENAKALGLTDIKVDVLKYPHHGNEFINDGTMSAVSPKYVIVPNNNAPNNPSNTMTNKITSLGGTIYRLSDSTTKSIVITSDGNNITFDKDALVTNYIW